MGLLRETLTKGIEYVREEVIPLKNDLMKAGLLKPDVSAFEPKANLTDPMNYGSLNFGYKEKWSMLDYSKCRQISYADPVIAGIIQVRLNQVAAFTVPQDDKYKTGFKIKMRDAKKSPTSADEKRIDEITKFITNTGVIEDFEDTPERKRRDSFEAFIRKIARDSLTYDQINFEITPRNNGLPYSFQAVDAATIRIIPDIKERVEYFGGAEKKNDKYNPFVTEHLAKTPFREFKPKSPKYVQLINGVPAHQFDEWEMAFGVRNPRTDILSAGYGFSEIEMLVSTITSHMNAETYNRRFFSQGATVKGILAFEGTVPPDQLEAFRRQWYMQSTGISNAWKTPILATGKDTKVNWVNLHSTNREMEFGKWLEYCIKTICGVYQIDPLEIGFDISKSSSGQTGSSGGLGHGDYRERVLFSQEKGLRPLLRHIQWLINEYIVYRLDPNFEFEFVGLNVKSEEEELAQAEKKAKSFVTVNEIRAEHDLKPIPDFDSIKSPGDLILDATWINAWAQAASAKQMQEQQAAQGGMDGQGEGEDQGQDPNAQPGAIPGGDEQPEEEPDFENMSLDELKAHLDKLNQPEEQDAEEAPAPKPTPKKPVKKSMRGELEL